MQGKKEEEIIGKNTKIKKTRKKLNVERPGESRCAKLQGAEPKG